MEIVNTNFTGLELQEALAWCQLEPLYSNKWFYSITDDYSEYTWYFAFEDARDATYFRLKFIQNKYTS
jgi:hypothetical protein